MLDKNTMFKDVAQFIQQPLPEARVKLAQELTKEYSEGKFSDNERILVEEILGLLVKDTAIEVRKIIVSNLKENEDVPHHLALLLAYDIDEIALPFLEYSPLLTSQDLVEIINATKNIKRWIAIASRRMIEPEVNKALIDTGNDAVIKYLLLNTHSLLSESDLGTILTLFSRHEPILTTLVTRGNLPLPVAERLISLVSDEVRDVLIKHYKIIPLAVEKIIGDSTKEALISMLTYKTKINDINTIIHHLIHTKKLSYSLLMRSLCQGDCLFFEKSLGVLSGHPEVDLAVSLKKTPNFNKIYAQACLPLVGMKATKIIYDYVRDMYEKGNLHSKNFGRDLVTYIEKNNFHKTIPMISYFLAFTHR